MQCTFNSLLEHEPTKKLTKCCYYQSTFDFFAQPKRTPHKKIQKRSEIKSKQSQGKICLFMCRSLSQLLLSFYIIIKAESTIINILFTLGAIATINKIYPNLSKKTKTLALCSKLLVVLILR